MAAQFERFSDFYPYYLSEHSNRTCRRLHFTGSALALGWLLAAILYLNPWFLLAALVSGYGLAWIGHFYFEKNQPATFRHPWYSLMGDCRMFWDILRGRIPF